ncbi:MAG: DUF3634 family protein [Nannocystaceae bacterium]|nr:DUF3634 family protein [Nannocystaceae bacterium]
MPAVLLLLVVGGVGYFVITRMQEIFCISVRGGRMLVVRGNIPTPLLQDLGDVLDRAGVVQARVRAVKTPGHAQIRTSGVDEGTAQRCRNVFGTHPIHQMRSVPMSEGSKNLGQWLGIEWLAWLLLSRRS